MATNCYSCNCQDNGYTTTPNCVDSYPECLPQNPCSEIISDMCVIHNPNGIFIDNSGDNIIIPENINIHSFIQLLSMWMDSNTYQYVVSTNTYGPILGLRTLYKSQNSFKLYWDFPNVPDPNVMPTQFKITVKERGTTLTVSYLSPSDRNTFIVYSYGGLVYTVGKSYEVWVELIDSNLNVLTSSVHIIVNL